MTVNAVRLNHAVLFVADLERAESFYMWMLPRRKSGEHENAAPIDARDLDGELARWSGVRTAGRVVAEPDADVAAADGATS